MEAKKKAVVLDGDPRGGKGKTAESFAETYSNVTADETGKDYRALTKALHTEGILEPGQSEGDIKQALAKIGIDQFYDLASRKQIIIDTFGDTSLYENEINTTVPIVGQMPEVRHAVKESFKTRIREMIKGNEHDILVVDGRNLTPVIESIEGIDPILRIFVSCTAEEAARRECLRQGINPTVSPTDYERIRKDIQRRKEKDANREIDKVAPDSNAIDYWFDEKLIDATIEQLLGLPSDSTRNFLTSPDSYTLVQRLGAGAVAATTRRQLVIDTSDFVEHHDYPREARLRIMHDVFEDAIGTTSLELTK